MAISRWRNADLGTKVRRRVGPRTTGSLQFRGVGVMKAIIQRAMVGTDRVKRKKKSQKGKARGKRERSV